MLTKLLFLLNAAKIEYLSSFQRVSDANDSLPTKRLNVSSREWWGRVLKW